jgi:hypothetical protein
MDDRKPMMDYGTKAAKRNIWFDLACVLVALCIVFIAFWVMDRRLGF